MSDQDLIRRRDVMALRGPMSFVVSAHAIESIPAATPTMADALALPEVRALVDAAEEYRAAIDAFDGSGSMADKLPRYEAARASFDAAIAPFKGGA
jgi:hypothetical protein